MNKIVERQKYILNQLFEYGFISTIDIAKELGVSDETVRRDINTLAERNMLKKVHGGAEAIHTSFRRDTDYISRLRHHQKQKNSIGIRAAMMIEDNMVVGLDCGVSVQSVVSALSGVNNVIFVTNSIPIAMILIHKIESGDISGKIVMIGGEIETKNRFSKGAIATDLLDRFRFDISFVSCTALTMESIFSYSLDECAYSARLIANSQKSVLIAQSDKLYKHSLYRFASLSDVDVLIVDDIVSVSPELSSVLSKENVELIAVSDTN